MVTPDAVQEVNGGVLNVESGGYARFLETVRISNIVVSSETDGGDHASDVWHGGAIYNEVCRSTARSLCHWYFVCHCCQPTMTMYSMGLSVNSCSLGLSARYLLTSKYVFSDRSNDLYVRHNQP